MRSHSRSCSRRGRGREPVDRGGRRALATAGTRFLVGTTPTCNELKANVEYRCTIKGAFESEIDGSLKGTVEPTVDATKHVNGGCRSVRADGREWRCYIGQAAVEQQIIGPDLLGEYAPSPGVG